MRTSITAAVTVALLGVAVAAQDVDRPRTDRGGARDQVAGLFAQNCSNCHLPPDPDFAVDRAWLHQVLDTA